MQLRQAGEDAYATVAPVAYSECHCHTLGIYAAGHEPDDLSRNLVQPLRVIHHAQQRLVLGCFGDEVECGKSDQELIGRGATSTPQGDAQRQLLRLGQCVKVIEERDAELMKSGESELALGLDARRRLDAESGGERGIPQMLQQRRLAHSRIAAHDQRPAVPGLRPDQQVLDHSALSSPTQKLRHDDFQ
ncbi:hypothetical protein GCM10011490_00440 [Pseudoclavibacter endophyticus]|nr:hypothetical protein GCM10011490_00440 [Pseudoclavibacter endophyticus]